MRDQCKECKYYHKENNTCQSKKSATGGDGKIKYFERFSKLFATPAAHAGVIYLPEGRKMNDKLYDVLRTIAEVVLPAIGTCYFALAGIWGLPYGEQIVGTITAVDACLGAIVAISNENYKKSQRGAAE